MHWGLMSPTGLLSNAYGESFALFNLVSGAADGPGPVQDFAGCNAVESKGCKMARVAKGGLVGRQVRKLKTQMSSHLGILVLC